MTPDLPTGWHSPSDRSAHPAGVIVPRGFAHVRLTVIDIHRSKDFYGRLLGREPGADFSDQVDEPGVRQDPERIYGGCSFTFEGQTLVCDRSRSRATRSTRTESDSTTSACWSARSKNCTRQPNACNGPVTPTAR